MLRPYKNLRETGPAVSVNRSMLDNGIIVLSCFCQAA